MQGLDLLYDHTGRRAEWKRLVEEIVPDFVDPANDGPLPEREEQWSLLTDYRVRLARAERQWAEAERLHEVCVTWDRQHAASALARPAEELKGGERNAIRTLAVSLHVLGEIRRELGRADCIPVYGEALELSEQIGDRALAAICAFNLGHAFKDLPTLRDLEQAERWYRRSLDLRAEGDRQTQGQCLAQLGYVALERFKEAQAAGSPEAELLRHLNEAARLYHEALDLLPPDAVNDLAVTHTALGAIYGNAGDLDRAFPHYRQAIHYTERSGNLYGAAQARFNMALDLLNAGRQTDALEYAEAALRGFESYGGRAADEVERTQRLIAKIRGAGPSPPTPLPEGEG